MADATGRWVWYDLMTTDVPAALRFYSDVVGWRTQEFENAAQPYTMFTTDAGPIGGAVDLPDAARAAGAPPHWLGSIATRDVDAVAARAKQLGGSVVVPPEDIPTVGRYAVLADPQGATFGVFASQGEIPVEDGRPGVGRFSWHELATTDYEAAFDFYSKLVGWTVLQDMDMGADGMYRIYGLGDVPFGGVYRKPAQMPGPPAWLYYAHVDDLDAALDRVRAGGGQVVNGPMEVPGGDRIAQCIDPQGSFFALHETAQA